MRGVTILLLALFLSGCGLIPKSVEIGQRKVQAVPAKKPPQIEAEKQAAKFTADKAVETLVAATREGASTNVTAPARETVVVASGLSSSLGSPSTPWSGTADALAGRLSAMEARLDNAIDAMRRSQARDVGKPIEGTGWFQVPYLVWVGCVAAFLFVVWTGLKIAGLIYPPVGAGVAGLSAVGRVSSSVVRRALEQTVRGAELFKESVEAAHFDDATKKSVLALFRSHQQQSQDEHIQTLVRDLTR